MEDSRQRISGTTVPAKLLVYVLAVITISASSLSSCHARSSTVAFLATSGQTTSRKTNNGCRSFSNTFICHAKPPPTSRQDLAKLLKFEKSLEEEEPTKLQKNAYDDGDDDEQVDFETVDWINITVPDHLHDKRIDSALEELLRLDAENYPDLPPLSRSQIIELLKGGVIYVANFDDKTKKPMVVQRKAYKIQAGQVVSLSYASLHKYRNGGLPTEVIPEKMPLDILFEDEHMVVLNKAAGMVVHPAAGNWNGTLVNALAHYLTSESPFGAGEFASVNAQTAEGAVVTAAVTIMDEPLDNVNGENPTIFVRPGIVHRLDKGTTGVIVVAKSNEALTKLSEAFKARRVKKTYVAMTVGNPGNDVLIDNYIARHPMHRQRMRVVPDNTLPNSRAGRVVEPVSGTKTGSVGKRAISMVNSVAFDGKLSVVEVKIQTGRTHQIRVHLQDRGTPVYGDDVYGIAEWNKKLAKEHGALRPFLHAHRLELNHPITNEHMIFVAPMASDMCRLADIVWPKGRGERPELFQDSS
jgi:23S rRNA pseudouridine1911/1915/1917 synthase